jgi:hypothetical protein
VRRRYGALVGCRTGLDRRRSAGHHRTSRQAKISVELGVGAAGLTGSGAGFRATPAGQLGERNNGELHGVEKPASRRH